MNNNNIVIRRGQVGQFGSLIGGFGVLVGALGFIWQGGFTPYILAFLGVGVVGLALWALMTPDDFKNFFTGRQVRYSTTAIFSTMLMIGIVALLYIFVQRQVIVGDITIDNRFTLSPTTSEIIDAVQRSPRDIEITGFYYPNQIVQREIDDQYWQLYAAATEGKITRNYVNPLEQPAFSQPYLDAIDQGFNTFVSFINDNGTLDRSSTVTVNASGVQERDMTEALARLLTAGSFKVYFERSLDTLDPLENESQQGMSTLNNLLRVNGFITDPLHLDQLARNGESIPRDASALVLARPRRAMSEGELAVIDDYLQRGGALFIAGDMLFTEQRFLAEGSPFNAYLWDNYGLRLTEAVVVDPAVSARSELEIISAAVFSNNMIGQNINVEGLPDSITIFNLARAVEVANDPPVNNGSVILTSEQAWGETNLDALATGNDFANDANADLQGPLTTVAWANDEDTGAQIVLVGDGEFLMNGQATSPTGNATLFLDSIGWMTGFTEEVQYAPQGFLTAPILFVDAQQLDTIAFITIVFLPGVMLVAAIAIWARRLRQ